jgi:ribulose-phosphate 3-epimerase
MKPVVPAIIPRSAEEIKELLPDLSFSPEVHLDVVDGVFVPFVSWPYEPVGKPSDVAEYTDRFTLEVDLMVADPVPSARSWIAAGADMLVFHVETISLSDFVQFAKSVKVSVGVSADNDTPLETLLSYASEADSVQCMGIAKIGSQGQSFDGRAIERIQAVKKQFPRLPVTVDGSVNEQTIAMLSQAGADRFICGSAIVKAHDKREAYQNLMALSAN